MILICTSYLSLPKSALKLTPFNFNIAIGYVTLVLVVTNISLDLLSANLYTSTGFDSSETNQTGAGDVITSRSRGKSKTLYLHYRSLYGYQTWPDGNLSCGLLPIKSNDPLIMWSCEIT